MGSCRDFVGAGSGFGYGHAVAASVVVVGLEVGEEVKFDSKEVW